MTPAGMTPHAFLELFDEFKSLAPAKIAAFVTIANGRVDARAWGSNANFAAALLTAHMLSSTGGAGGQGGAAGGALTNEQVGDVSRGYATVFEAGSGDSALMTTRYGIDYVALRKESVVGATVNGPSAIPSPWC